MNNPAGDQLSVYLPGLLTRIIVNGNGVYRIQYKGFFKWRNLKKLVYEYDDWASENINFKSVSEANNYLNEASNRQLEAQLKRERAEKWRVVCERNLSHLHVCHICGGSCPPRPDSGGE